MSGDQSKAMTQHTNHYYTGTVTIKEIHVSIHGHNNMQWKGLLRNCFVTLLSKTGASTPPSGVVYNLACPLLIVLTRPMIPPEYTYLVPSFFVSDLPTGVSSCSINGFCSSSAIVLLIGTGGLVVSC